MELRRHGFFLELVLVRKTIQMLVLPPGTVYMLPLDGSPMRDLTVAGWNSLDTFDWSVDSRGFFRQHDRIRINSVVRGSEWQSTPLWQHESSYLTWGVPSPDGRYLAILGAVQWQHVDGREFLKFECSGKKDHAKRYTKVPLYLTPQLIGTLRWNLRAISISRTPLLSSTTCRSEAAEDSK